MRLNYLFACLAFFLLGGCGLFLPDFLNTGAVENSALAGTIFINEISADNPDADDWIELYNGGTATIDLSGFFLSDDALTPAEWEISKNTYIASGSFLVIVCDGSGNGLKASFRLNPGVDGVYLSTPREALTIESVPTIAASGKLSFGRTTNGGVIWGISNPTPARSNS